jgi:predicted ArsR family transcriptional regulator
MPTNKDQRTCSGEIDHATPSAIQERILRVLGLTSRPLQSGEIENALGLVATEARRAFESLTDQGYISTVRGKAAAQKSMTSWSLADKGRSWAKGQGALLAL